MKNNPAPEEIEMYSRKGDNIFAVLLLFVLIGATTVAVIENLHVLVEIVK